MNFIHRTITIICLFTSMLLAGCGTFAIEIQRPEGEVVSPPPSLSASPAVRIMPSPTPEPLLSRGSSSEEIRLRMLRGYDLWSSVWVDGRVDDFAPDGQQVVDSRHVQAWVDQKTFQLRQLRGPLNGTPETIKVGDGRAVVDFDARSGRSDTQQVPDGVREPFSTPAANPQVITPHPLGSLLDPPMSEMLFPTELAQRGGIYLPVREEAAAGRPTLVVDWLRESGGARVDRFWMDTTTGVLLRWQNYGKAGGEPLQREVILFQAQFYQTLPTELFKLPVSTLPQFATDYSGTPANTFSAAPTAAGQIKTPISSSQQPTAVSTRKTGVANSNDKNTLAPSGGSAGTLYFEVIESAQNVRLVRLPADCLAQGRECPMAQDVAGFPNPSESAMPLAWSPDGKRAALPSIVGGNGHQPGLYLFDAQNDQWQQLAGGFPFIYTPVTWSPDGQWVVFAAQKDGGREDIYTVHPDGSGLRNLTAGHFPEADFHPALLGWVHERLVFMAVHAQKSELFTWKIGEDKPATFLQGRLNGKADLVISPDSSMAAYTDGGTLYVTDTNGSVPPRRLASFQDNSVYLLTWAPDNASLAFAVMGASQDVTGNEVYTVNAIDGTGLRQIFKGGQLISLTYSPNGNGLVMGADNGTGTLRLFWSDLVKDAAPQMIQVPGLRLDEPWLGVSLQPIK